MRTAWKIFRALVSVLLLLAVLIPVSLYVLLSVDGVQNTIRDVAATELSRLLGADISIGKVGIRPFNRLAIDDVALTLDSDSIAGIDRISAGFDLFHFLRTREVVIDYALLDGVDVHISRADSAAPLNIQPIIDHLSSDKPSEEKPFELRINTVILRNTSLSYDDFSAAPPDSGRFCPQHIAVTGLALNAYIPRLSNQEYRVHLDHLSLTERSGFTLKALQAKASVSRTELRVSDFSLSLPESSLGLMPIELRYNGYNDIRAALERESITVSTSDICVIYPPDLRAFVPVLGDIDCRLALTLDAAGTLSDISLRSFGLRDVDGDAFNITATGNASSLTDPESFCYDLSRGSISFDGKSVCSIFHTVIPASVASRIAGMERYTALISAEGTAAKGRGTLKAFGTAGDLEFTGSYARRYKGVYSIKGDAGTSGLDLGLLLSNPNLGKLTTHLSGNFVTGRHPSADVSAKISELGFKGYTYTGIDAIVKMEEGREAELYLSADDPAARLMAYFMVRKDDAGYYSVNGTATAAGVDLAAMGFDSKHPDHRLGVKLNVEAEASELDDIDGTLSVYDLRWTDRSGKGLNISRATITASPYDTEPTLTVDSDILKGEIRGEYSLLSLGPSMRDIASVFMPVLLPPSESKSTRRRGKTAPMPPVQPNDFTFDFTLKPCENLTDFFGVPFAPIYDAEISGRVDSRAGQADIRLSAPYVRKGSTLYTDTEFFASADTSARDSRVYLTTQFPTNKGDMVLSALLTCADNRVNTHVDWLIERAIPLNGTVDFSTLIRGISPKGSDAVFPVDARVDFNHGTINFGDDVWKIQSSSIDVSPQLVTVDNFRLDAGTQSIDIHGNIGRGDDDMLSVVLDKISLLPIFETLQIDNALLSGRASGTFTARDLLGSEPYFACPKLHVDSIGYQHCTIGDADIFAGWNNERKSFFLDADITGLEGHKSKITGDILPIDQALDISFDADSVPVDFLKPFMAAFTSSITGRASGRCRLFGTFKDIDLEGDIFADNVRLKVDFTGTTYTATDSVHIRPGIINLNNLLIRDTEGHTARLNGFVRHTCFHEPVFRFDVTDAVDFLSYNTTAADNPDWYGTIYGNGSVSISGQPGVVNIGVNMSTAPRSHFTFVLSDRLDAEDYSFITFRDATPDSIRTIHFRPDDTPEAVKQFRRRIAQADDIKSDYNMDIQVTVNKDAEMRLVVDPVGGDEIKAVGDGTLHLAYHSDNNDLSMWGKYNVAYGSYRFTLQDIILKDFVIKEGSEIAFDGDPYGVKTNLQAYYATNANLSDLDESFLQDKEVARTNVPVHAVMKVTGDIRQPGIDFDLEFPTLTSDTYRKVRSIVSTEDMMNRQIIYLLALNRFYTPDYMAATTKGSELFSVASSTISSQLGNMLGKLSDNWSIAPNLRSDRGDFSDVEVDVALSSRLLNNRLLFNGNFGYRDKSLNSNQFVGDFDIEYLLNKRGSWRLKAYNRYNDRNYYIRSAQTTQGVGIIFRRDFDSMLSFLTRLRKKNGDKPESKENPQ